MNDDRPTILIVDDASYNLTLMRELLKPFYRTTFANSGQRALKLAAEKEPPQLILLDIMMPDMDGYEVCERLKSNPATENIPVIFVSAKGEPDD